MRPFLNCQAVNWASLLLLFLFAGQTAGQLPAEHDEACRRLVALGGRVEYGRAGDERFSVVIISSGWIGNQADLQLLEKLHELRCAILTHRSITDQSLLSIARLTSLEQMTLRESLVTNQGISHLIPLQRLKGLNLSGTAVTADGIISLN